MMQSRIGKIAISIIAVLAIGLLSFGTGLASVGNFDTGIGIFADQGRNGNGNGNQGQGQSDDDHGNNGQGQSDEDHGNNGQGQNDDDHGNNGQGQNDDDHGNNGQGQNDDDHGNNGQGQNDDDHGNNGQGQNDDDQGDDDNPDVVVDDDATPAPGDDDNGKVGICHTTGSDSNPAVFIEVNEHAVPAHEGHGDDIGADSPEDCAAVGATPGAPGDDDGTPVASPVDDIGD